MKRLLPVAAILAASLFPVASQPASAQSYPIDCAILLCLAGGWPPSVPCTRARAEFIRRITPYPVEPPLQIWRCPMRMSFNETNPVQRLHQLAEGGEAPEWSVVSDPHQKHRAEAVGLGADIDVSDPSFDFIRSIDVFEAFAWQRPSNNGQDCNRMSRVRHGTYDLSGQFHWRVGSMTDLPPAFRGAERYGEYCPHVLFRAVFVDWQDHQGVYGSEQVNY